MSQRLPLDYYFTETHEWVSAVGSTCKIGISAYAVEQMNKDIVAIELPQPGTVFLKGDVFGVIDSVKAAFDLMAPVGLKVTELNPAILNDPADVAESPFEKGWMIKGVMSDPNEIYKLMDAPKYQEFLKSEKH